MTRSQFADGLSVAAAVMAAVFVAEVFVLGAPNSLWLLGAALLQAGATLLHFHDRRS